MRRYAARKDANDLELAKIATQCGAYVQRLSEEAGYDWLIWYRGATIPVEIKDGNKPPSQRRLTPAEKTMHGIAEAHGVKIQLILNESDLMALLGSMGKNSKLLKGNG